MKQIESQSPYQTRAHRSTLKLFFWVAVWVASFAIATFGPRLLWDSAGAKITNIAEANKYLAREYRPGWELL